MCEPTTIAIVAGGLQVAGAVQKGIAAKQAAEANAALLEENARTADQAGGDAVLRGRLLEGRVRTEGEQVANKQKTAFAAAGVDVKSGSALDVLGDTGMLSELDAQVVRSNAFREAWGYKTQASQFRRRAGMERQAGDNALVGSILGGIAQGGQYASMLSIGGGRVPEADWSASPLGGASYT